MNKVHKLSKEAQTVIESCDRIDEITINVRSRSRMFNRHCEDIFKETAVIRENLGRVEQNEKRSKTV